MAEKKQAAKKQARISDKTKLLEDLFEHGFATRVVDIIPNKLSATVRTLNANDQLQLENSMKDVDGSYAYLIHTYSLRLLSYTITKYGENEFKSIAEATKFFEAQGLSSVLVEKLVKEQQKLEKDTRASLNLEEVETAFFEQGPQQKGPAPLPKESISGKKGAYAKQ